MSHGQEHELVAGCPLTPNLDRLPLKLDHGVTNS